MNISEIRVKLVSENAERLRAFCSVTFDGAFVVRDLKVIDGANGPFVAMPSRKLADRCAKCGIKNHLRARFCNECGSRLRDDRAPKDGQGRVKLHADVAHPINAACREEIQKAVIAAFEEELEQAQQPGYRPQTYDDLEDPPRASEYEDLVEELRQSTTLRREGRRGDKAAGTASREKAPPVPAGVAAAAPSEQGRRRSVSAADSASSEEDSGQDGSSDDFSSGLL